MIFFNPLAHVHRREPGDLPGGVRQQRLCDAAEFRRGLYRGYSGAASGPREGLLHHHLWQLPAQLLWHVAGDAVPHEEAYQGDPHHQTD